MKKIISLFKRDYEGTRLVYDELVEDAEWVKTGEGIATEKFDGTACLVRDGSLYKRYDRKKKKGKYKSAPEGWEACQEPDEKTGHWPGWLPVGDGPEDQWHRSVDGYLDIVSDGTYELVGEKVRGNPYNLSGHFLYQHGFRKLHDCPRDFEGLKSWFADNILEGIVWHHHDGRMVKIKRKDFGYNWP